MLIEQMVMAALTLDANLSQDGPAPFQVEP